MATQIKRRRGGNTEVNAFTPAVGEIVVNTTDHSLHVGDGVGAGGHKVAMVDSQHVTVFTTAASATASTDLGKIVNGAVITIGDRGSSSWDIVPAGTYTPDASNILGENLLNHDTLSFQFKLQETLGLLDDVSRGAAADGVTDDTGVLNNMLTQGGKFSAIQLSEGSRAVSALTYNMNNLSGKGKKTVLVPTPGASVLVVANETPADRWIMNKISDMTLSDADRSFDVDGITFSGNNYTGKTTFDHVDFEGLNSGINKTKGNIGNQYNRCTFGYSDFGIIARDDSSGGLMHAGGDIVTSGHFQRTNNAAIYISDSTDGAGMFTLDNPIIEANYGYGVLVNGFSANIPIIPIWLRQVWLEGNATSVSVTVDGYTAAPKDLCFRNAAVVVADGTYLKDVRLESTTLVANTCRMDNASSDFDIEVDDQSAMNIFNFYGNRTEVVHEYIQNYAHSHIWTGTSVGAQYMGHRCVKTAQGYGFIASEPFNSGGTYSWSGTNSTNVVDGLLFDACTELTVPAGTFLSPATARAPITTGKWNVVTMGFKQTVGALTDMEVNFWNGGADRITVTSQTSDNRRKLNQWYTAVALIDSVDRATTSNLSIYLRVTNAGGTMRFCDYQTMAFDTKQDALNYIDNREYQV